MVAAAYLRRSFASVSNPGDASREAQEEAVRSLCGPDVTIYADWGVSGRGDGSQRPDYQRLKSDIAAGKVTSVCAYSLSRLGRDTKELLGFVELCNKRNVAVRTKVESLDTTSAMGRAMLTVMAAFGQLEAELAQERGAAARTARKARHEAAGALLPGGGLPNSVPAYGFRHVPEPAPDGQGVVFRRDHDPERPMEPILAAYHDAGETVRGACQLLKERGIPAPEPACPPDCGKAHHRAGCAKTGCTAQHGHQDGLTWGSSTLARILRAHTAKGCDHGIVLPDRNASGKARKVGQPALFASILRCHCGRTMTPSVNRKDHATGKAAPSQYYCSGARDRGRADHGRGSVTEAALKAALWPEVARQYRSGARPKFAERNETAIADLEARKERVSAALLDGLIGPAKAKAEHEAIDARLIKLQRIAGAWIGFEANTPLDLNGDPAEQNALLRRLWLRADLDADMVPHVEWIIDPDVARGQEEATEAAYNAEGPDGEPSQAEREADQVNAERYGTPDQHPYNRHVAAKAR